MVISNSESSPTAGERFNPLALIRHATAQQHSQLERDIDWSRAFSTPAHYLQLLTRFARVVEPLEREIGQFWPDESPDSLESKTMRLHSDIATLKRCYAVEPETEAADHFDPAWPIAVDQATAWGARYVLEGSALGGQILARQLQASASAWPPPIDTSVGSAQDATSLLDSYRIDRYFLGRGTETGAYWQTFCLNLNRALQDNEAAGLAARAAVQTFACFHSSLNGKAGCVH